MRILVDGQTLATPEANRGIGVYFKNILNAMLENDMTCEWYITTHEYECLGQLKPWAKNRLTPVIRNEFDPNYIHKEGFAYQEIFTQALNEEIHNNKIDIYWTPNPLMDNVFFPTSKLATHVIVTIHDLIPMVFADYYLCNWPKTIVNEYKERLRRIKNCSYGVIFDSASAQKDFKSHVGDLSGQGYVVHLGVNNCFQPSMLCGSKSTPPYILFTGGFDYRKNMERALEAFSQMIALGKGDNMISNLELVIVCAYSLEAKAEYKKLACKLGVENRLVLTGYVDDYELQKLYQECEVFFFPSLYEGFGLPVLEAMASGAPVVTSKVSSLPEVGGEYAYYCDPYDIENMAQTLLKTLTEYNSFNQRIRKERISFARSFTWDKASRKTISVFRDINFGKNIKTKSRPKIAYVSPMPPQRSGIANYSKLLLPYLAQYCSIDVFTNGIDSKEDVEGIENAYSISALQGRNNQYDCIIYHLGNNSEFHKDIYDLAWRIPGIIVLHDYNLHPFLQQGYLMQGEKGIYKQALIEGYGEVGENHYRSVKAGTDEPDIWKFPMSHAIVKRSRATIVHHRWVKKQYPEEFAVNVIPLFTAPVNIKQEEQKADTFKQKYGIKEQEFIIGCYGFINQNKRPEIIVKAISQLRDKGYPVRLIFAGEPSPDVANLTGVIEDLGLQNAVIMTGFLGEEEYHRALAVTDIVVNLRYPSMGEASMTLAESLARGKPTIVSAINQYLEFPDRVCWKLDIGDNEIELLVAYLETLLRNSEVRGCLGRNGRKFASNVIDVYSVAWHYFSVIKSVLG